MSALRHLDKIPCTAQEHFRLLVLGIVLKLLNLELRERSYDDYVSQFPFLQHYADRILELSDAKDLPTPSAWDRSVTRWAKSNPALPFSQLGPLRLAPAHIAALLLVAAQEEDPRLFMLIEPGGTAPTLGGLAVLLEDIAELPGSLISAREAIETLVNLGLLNFSNHDAPRIEWQPRVPPAIFSLLTGIGTNLPGLRMHKREALPDPKNWVPPRSESIDPAMLGEIMAAEDCPNIIVRSDRHNGRKTLLMMAARKAKLNVLQGSANLFADEKEWRQALLAALLTRSLLLVEAELGPGDRLLLPSATPIPVRLAIAATKVGNIECQSEFAPLDIELVRPDLGARKRHWKSGIVDIDVGGLDDLMLTSGNIRRSAAAAQAITQMERSDTASEAHVRRAVRTLRDPRLDSIAARIGGAAELDALFLDVLEQEELDNLIIRCRFRERLSRNSEAGVKVIMTGPSGTGKTLAARHVAEDLGRELYRIDLSATVNKYIGETEKNLEKALAAAEEMDVVLLLDEGDALMARRTDVSSSTDRYANMETNFLFQRLENFRGIILITTNDGERIDSAFRRRMDAIITFRMPDEVRRLGILQAQLGEHQVREALLQDIACRCLFSGGQLHNVAVHARLLSLADQSAISDDHLLKAITREYRKTGDHCPLKPTLSAVG